jgi:hypothetical protein
MTSTEAGNLLHNEYYNYVVDICDIGVDTFVMQAQVMLVEHLRAE